MVVEVVLSSYSRPGTSSVTLRSMDPAVRSKLMARGASLVFPLSISSSGTLTYFTNGRTWSVFGPGVALSKMPNGIPGLGVTFSGLETEGGLETSYQTADLSSIAVSAWIKVLSSQGPQVLVSTRNGAANDIGLTLSLGAPTHTFACRLAFGLDGPNIWNGVIGTSNMCSGHWEYVAAVWKGMPGKPIASSEFSLYVNGREMSSYSSTYSIPGSQAEKAPLSDSGFLLLGTNDGGWRSVNDFSLANLCIYSRIQDLSKIVARS